MISTKLQHQSLTLADMYVQFPYDFPYIRVDANILLGRTSNCGNRSRIRACCGYRNSGSLLDPPGIKPILIFCQHHMSVDAMHVIETIIVNAFKVVDQFLGGRDDNPVTADDFVDLDLFARGPGGEPLVIERVIRRGNRVSILGPSLDSTLTILLQVADDPPPQYAREQVARHDVSSWTRYCSEQLLKITTRSSKVLP